MFLYIERRWRFWGGLLNEWLFIQILIFLVGCLLGLWYYNKIRVRPSVQSDPTPKPYKVLVHVEEAKAHGITFEKKYHWDLLLSVVGSEDNIKAAQFKSYADHRVHGFFAYLTEEQVEAISRNAGVHVVKDAGYVFDDASNVLQN